MSSNQHIYSLIDIDDFNLKSSIVTQIFDYIIQDSWQVTSLSCTNSFNVGYSGPTYDPSFIVDINGSVRITGETRLLDNVYIGGITTLDNDTYTTGNASFSQNIFIQENLKVLGDLNLTNATINNDLTVLNTINVSYLNVSQNASINNLTIYGNSSFFSNVNISKLTVSNQTNLNSLNVSTNASIQFLYVNQSTILNDGITINNSSTIINNSLIVNSGITQINDGLIVTNNGITVTETGGLTQLKNGLTVIGETIFNSGGLTITSATGTLDVNGDTDLNKTLTVGGATKINNILTVASATSLQNALTVTGATALNNGLTVTGATALNTGLSVTGATALNNTLTVTGSTNLIGNAVTNNLESTNELTCKNTINSGYVRIMANNTGNLYENYNFYVQDKGFIQTLRVGSIRYDTAEFASNSNVVSYDNVNNFKLNSVLDNLNNNVFKLGRVTFGSNISQVFFNNFGFGHFVYGLNGQISQYTNAYAGSSTFDLSAVNLYSGITYNGPINIGKNAPSVFNVTATGSSINLYNTTGNLHYDGSIYIGQNPKLIQDENNNQVLSKTSFDLEAEGTIMYDGLILIGQNSANTVFDLSASYFDTGINYNGPINIGGQNPYTLNINGGGLIDYEGIINLNGLLSIDSTNLPTILEINENSNPIFTVNSKGNTNILGNLGIGYINASSIYPLDVSGNMRLQKDMLIGGNITSYSDARLKDNITPLTNCLYDIDSISGYSFTRNDLSDSSKIHIGLIAQEVEKTYPELVIESNNIKSINYQSFSAILVECVKELKERIKILENKILS